MKIHISDIKADGHEASFELDRDALDLVLSDPRGEIHGGPEGLSVDVRLDRLNDTILIKGQIVVDVGYTCVRCSAGRQMGLVIPLVAVLMPRPGEQGHPFDDDEEGLELSAEDLDVTFYEGTEIDLNDVVREAIFLEVPDYPSCGIEPKEECPDWQANMAAKVQQMDADKNDLRWEALKAIKARMADQKKD